jgi:hypothetical protein
LGKANIAAGKEVAGRALPLPPRPTDGRGSTAEAAEEPAAKLVSNLFKMKKTKKTSHF